MTQALRKLTFAIFLTIVVIVLFVSGLFGRMNFLFYDNFIRLIERPANQQILLINIDDKSLKQLGRWPWQRQVHAQLLNRLTNAEVSSVGFDILFSEADKNQSSDQAFADAIGRNGRVTIAVSPERSQNYFGISELLPLTVFAKQANKLAHVDFELDKDGICRSVYLYAGMGDSHWPAFALALQNKTVIDRKHTKSESLSKPRLSSSATKWIREKKYLIPFVGPTGTFDSVSYIDVLKNRVSKQQLTDKIVLIGMTASGFGDVISTPMSIDHQLMPGVEVNANVLAGLLDNIHIVELSVWLQLFITLLLMILFYRLIEIYPNRFAPILFVLAVIGVLLFSAILFAVLYFWLPPLIMILGLILVYFIWDWMELMSSSTTIHKLKDQVYFQARHDEVTALPNRTLLQELTEQAIMNNSHNKTSCALVVISLGRFKAMNDSLGFKAGDILLNLAAQRLKNAIHHEHKIARLSGGEFAIFMDSIQDEEALRHYGAIILQSLQLTFDIDGGKYYLPPRIGIAMYPQDANNAENLFNNAQIAMHQAKRDRIRSLYFFSPGLKDEKIKQSALEQDLYLALKDNQFEVYYQPQVDSLNTKIIGFEALIRWHHPKRGLVSPADFIPLAEYTGDIIPIGYWVLETACIQACKWQKQGLTNLRMAVNLSAVQFTHKDLLERVKETLQKTGLAPQHLELELTEGILMDDIDATTKTLKAFKELGIQLSVDDFGTGFSSLNYLKRFPMDRIKIDQSFVCDLGSDVATSEIIMSIIDMAHRLNMEVIAEGIETVSQKNFLQKNSCEELQGFFFSKPVPAQQISDLIDSSRGLFSALPDKTI